MRRTRWRRHPDKGYLCCEVYPAAVVLYVHPVRPTAYSDGRWGLGFFYETDPDARVYSTHTYLTEGEAIRAGERYIESCFARLRKRAVPLR
jgi:hypothetical protein